MAEKVRESIQWLQFTLNGTAHFPIVSNWGEVYHFLDKHKILGVCSPLSYNVRIEQGVLLQWIGDIEQIKASSTLLNKRTMELCRMLEKDGLRCCVLKGQGNAMMYPEPLLRMPGDIDVWIDGGQERIISYVRSKFPEARECFKHIKFPVFDDVEVDVHLTPLKFCHPKYNRRLQRWIASMKENQMSNHARLTGMDSDIAIPTADFNAVYQMGHILIHLMDEGIGLRHMVDYYYVLKVLKYRSIVQQEVVRRTLNECGMMRLASAVMWVEYKVLGLDRDCLLASPDERLGMLILEDILEGGNFGKYAVRHVDVGPGRIKKRIATLRRLIRLSPIARGEFLCHGVLRAGDLLKSIWSLNTVLKKQAVTAC